MCRKSLSCCAPRLSRIHIGAVVYDRSDLYFFFCAFDYHIRTCFGTEIKSHCHTELAAQERYRIPPPLFMSHQVINFPVAVVKY
jgi:hypothetical protein